MRHLDFEAAKAGQAITRAAKKTGVSGAKAENLLMKALGVLQKNGPYACILYLSSQAKEEKMAEIIYSKLLNLAEMMTGHRPKGSSGCEYISDHVCTDLEALLLVKRFWEQTLIYARYGAKAMEDG
ncbi:MAG: hypothetical protein WBJ06_08065 [Candidatus Methanoculleus thermohydrogenotrophicum]|jgi:hypothetical protein